MKYGLYRGSRVGTRDFWNMGLYLRIWAFERYLILEMTLGSRGEEVREKFECGSGLIIHYVPGVIVRGSYGLSLVKKPSKDTRSKENPMLNKDERILVRGLNYRRNYVS